MIFEVLEVGGFELKNRACNERNCGRIICVCRGVKIVNYCY